MNLQDPPALSPVPSLWSIMGSSSSSPAKLLYLSMIRHKKQVDDEGDCFDFFLTGLFFFTTLEPPDAHSCLSGGI